MKSIFKGYHLCLIATLLAVLIFAPIAQRAWAGWEHFDPNTSNLPSSHINTLAMDPNRLWIGTNDGLVEKKLSSDDPNTGWIKDLKVDPNLYAPVSSMDIDQNMVLWLGTAQGLISYDPESSDPNNPFIHSGLSFIFSDEIQDIEVDTNFVWVATDTGLNRFDKSSETWVRYSNDPNDPNGFDSSAAWAVESGDDDTIWVLPSFPSISGGVYRYVLSTDQWDHFSTKAGPGQTEVIFNSLVMGDSNDIWLGSYNGLWRFETNHPDPNDAWTQWEDANSGLPSNSIQAIGMYRGFNKIIVATTDGIARYDLDLGLWQPISTPASLDLASQIIKYILVDPNHNQVWFGTESDGLYCWKEGAIIWSNPANGAENVSIDTNAIEIMFNDSIDPNSNKIELGPPGSTLTFEMFDSDDNLITDPNIYDPNDFTWRFLDSNINIHLFIEPNQPNYDLYPDTWYSFKFDTDILYQSGKTIGGVDTLVKFKTIIVPEVVDTDPDPNDTDVNPYDPIHIWFNKSMDLNSFFSPYMVTFQAEGDILPTSINEEEMDFPDPNYLVISISGDPSLEPGKKYTFTVNENVTDLSGNLLSESFEFQFTTKAAPQVAPVPGAYPYPEDSATDVSIDTNIAVLFDSPMDTNSVEAGFSLDSNVTGEFFWFDSDTKVVFQPHNPLTSGVQYEVTIDTNARDKYGIPFEIPYTWFFTTGDTPMILSILPQENEDLVSIYANIEIRFSSTMDENSVEGAFSLLDDQNTPVSGSFNWNQDSTEFRFIPSDPLDPNHNYKASITTSAQSQSGPQLSQGKTWEFTTVSLETISPPEGGWPVFHIMGMDPNSISVTAMAMNPMDGGIWTGLASLDPNSKWMGIGLFHYDGNDWKQYTSSDPNCGLTSDSINDLTFDSQGNLWIATEPDPDDAGGGVNMFDGQTWHWYDPNTFHGLSNIDDADFLYVNAIDIYSAGTEDMIWIATTGGIAVGKYSSYSNDWEWSATTEFPFTSLIAVDNLGGTVWVASDPFMNNPNEPCNSIAGFDAEKLSRWQPDIGDPNFRVWSPDGGPFRKKSPEERINYNLRAMTVDGFGNLWMGTKDRLYKINIDDLLAGECNFESCDYIETKGGLLPDSIYDLIVNPADPNELWVATDSGISILKITEPIKSPDSWTRNPITDSLVLTILPGSSGEVYAGTDKGLMIIAEPILPETWIHSTCPVQGAQSVSTSDPKIQINFTRVMDPDFTESAFCLQVDPNFDPGSACMIGTFNWYNNYSGVRFIPDKTLDQGTFYVLTIDETARDIYGNSLPIPFSIKFKTELDIPPVFFLPENPIIFEQDLNRESNEKRSTRVVSNGQGYLCVWQEKNDITGMDILGQIVGPNGSLMVIDTNGTEKGYIINISLVTGDQVEPDLDSDGNNYLVVWSDRGGPNTGICGALISNDGTILEEKISIKKSSGDLRFPRVKWNEQLQHYLVAWEKKVDDVDPSISKAAIYGNLVDQNGQVINQEEEEEIAIDHVFNKRSIRASYDLASLGDPNMPSWLIVWNGSAQDTLKSGFDIMGRFLYEDSNGKLYFDKNKDPFKVSIPGTDQLYPSVEAMGDEFLVVWEENWKDEEGVINKDIGGIKLNARGDALGNIIDISSATNNQELPEVAANGQVYFVVWLDQRDSKPDQPVKHVYGVRVSPEGLVLQDDTNTPSDEPSSGTRISTDHIQTPWPPAVASTGPGDYRCLCIWSVREGEVEDTVWSLIGRIYVPPPPPKLECLGPPNYDEDGVHPDSDFGGSQFTFKVEYFSHEAINAKPEIAHIWIDLDDNGSLRTNEVFSMTGESYSEYKNGRIYSYSNPNMLYDGDGELMYRFFFKDKYNVASGDPTKVNTFQVYLYGSQPTLDWTNEPDFTGDGVRPDDIEFGTDISFEFRVIYQDEDGDQPQNMELWVDVNGNLKIDPNEKWEMEADGSSYQQGQIYTKTVEFDFYSAYWMKPVIYKFESDDGKNKAIGEPRVLSYFTINPIGETSACLNIHSQLFPSITSTGRGYQVFWQDDREKELDANDVLIVTNHVWMELLSEDGHVKDGPGEPGQIRIDKGSKGAFKPLAQFDPETQKTLVIWEDLRNGSIRELSADDENLFKPEAIYEGLDIYGIFIDAEGNPLIDTNDSNPEGEFIVAGSTSSKNRLNPDMAKGADGQYIIVYESESRIDYAERTEIWAKFIGHPEGVGDRIWIQIAVPGRDSPGDGHQLMPRIAWNGRYYLAVWQDIGIDIEEKVDPIKGYYFSRLYGIRIDPNGELYHPETGFEFFNDSSEIQKYPNQKNLSDPNVNQLFPDVASDGENFLIVWQDSRYLGTEGGYDIYGMRVNVDGMAIDYLDKPYREIPICTADGHQIRPRVFWDSQAGQYIIMWLEIPYELLPDELLPGYMFTNHVSIPSQRISGSIKVVRMNPDGRLIDSHLEDEKYKYEGTSIIGVSATQDRPDMACDPNLGCRLIWEEVRNILSYDIYSSSYQSILNWAGDPNKFENDGVDPDKAESGSIFTFKIEYRDRLDIPPDVSQVWIDLNSNGTFEAEEKFDMVLADSNTPLSQGVIYTFTKKIDFPQDPNNCNIILCRILYRFYFQNEKGEAQGLASRIKYLLLTVPTTEPIEPGLGWQVFHKGKPISSLAVDQYNILWVGFRLLQDPETKEILDSSGGMARLEGDEWTYFRQGDDVLSLQITPTDNNLWAWTSAGLLEYDGSSWKTYTDTDPNINSLDMAADNQGRIWVVKSEVNWPTGISGDTSGFYGDANVSIDPNLYDIDPNAFKVSSKLIRYESGEEPDPDSNVTSEGNFINSLTTDVNGQVWMGILDIDQDTNGMVNIEPKGIVILDPETGDDKRLEDVYPGYPGGNLVFGLDKDNTGDIWVTSIDSPDSDFQTCLIHFDHVDKTWTHYINGEGVVEFVNNFIRAIDRRGDDLWLGHGAFPNPFSGEIVFGGATHHDMTGTDWQHHTSENVSEDFNYIRALVIDQDGIVWFGTSDGLYRYAPNVIIRYDTVLAFTDQDFHKGVFPDTGMSGYSFEFRVQYSDENNEPPDKAQVWIDLNDDGQYDDYEKFDMSPLEPNDQNYKDGVIFSYIKSIDYAGGGSISYRFYFEKADSPVPGAPALDHNLYFEYIPYDDSGFLDIIDSNGILGHYVLIPIQIQNSPNSVHSFSFEITYDPYILEYNGYLSGEGTKQFDYFDVYQPEDPGMLKIGGFELGEHIIQSGSDYIIAFLEFRVIGCKESNHTSKLAIGNLKDDFSNWSYSGGHFICIIDNEPPVPDVDPLPAIIKDCVVRLDKSQFPTATDEFAGVIIAETNDTLNYNEQGVYTITWTYADGFGNTTSQEQQIVILDDEDPNIHQMEGIPKGEIEYGKNVALKVKATDNCGDYLVYEWIKSDIIIGEESALTYKFGKGEHKVIVMVTDMAGNTSVSETIIIKVKEKKPSSMPGGDQKFYLFGGKNGLFQSGGFLYSSLLPNYNYSYTSNFSRYPANMTSFMMPYAYTYPFSNYDCNFYSYGYRFPFINYNEWKGYPYSIPLNSLQYGMNMPYGIQYEYNRWFSRGNYGTLPSQAWSWQDWHR